MYVDLVHCNIAGFSYSNGVFVCAVFRVFFHIRSYYPEADTVLLFLSNLDVFYFLFLLTALGQTFGALLNRSAERRQPCLVSDSRGRRSGFHCWAWCLLWALLTWLCFVEIASFYSSLVVSGWFFCLFLIIKGYWILSNTFSVSVEMIMYFLSFC